MNRITSFCLLALLAGGVSLACLSFARIAPAQAVPSPTLSAQAIGIGMTKAQVKKALGKPNRTSKDQNTWYYGKRAIEFKNDKVSGFPGAAG